MKRIVLDLCGGTGAWSRPYRDAGYDVRIVTLPLRDVRLYTPPANVHGILAAPPCADFSYVKHYHGAGNYSHDFFRGLSVVSACARIILLAKPQWWALENPRGYLVKWLGEPTFQFDPWEFGDGYRKRTNLWGLFNHPVPVLTTRPPDLPAFPRLPSATIHPEYLDTLSRTERRAVTPSGFATAFFNANP